ncbi:MAG: ECF transporter S component [Lachnospiraceae bacterium]|nr:ECF transporter S component [Lachnospiraceae bacterium]
MKSFLQSVANDVLFAVEFLGIVTLIFLLAYAAEKWMQKRQGRKEKIFTTRKMAMIGMFSALATILMILEIPVFFTPGFYKLDFSELPALIGGYAFGPVAGVMIEFCKILLKLMTKGTSTAMVGELANFVVGCSFILPASFLYWLKKSKKSAIFSSIVGTLIMTVVGSWLNGLYLLPTFANMFGMPLTSLVGMGTAVNPYIKDVTTLVLFAVVPLNLLKGSIVSLITILIYKKLSPILKIAYKK